MSKTIPQLNPASSLSLTDKTEVSQSDSSSASSVYGTYEQLINYIVNPNSQITQAQVTGLAAALAGKLSLSGGTMTGFLTLNADPITNLQAATKQYVDGSFSAVNLNTAYANTSGQNFNITNNLNFLSGNVNIGTSTSAAPLTVVGAGGTTFATAALAAFSSSSSPSSGDIYQIYVNKSSIDALLMGINKNSSTGQILGNSVFISTYSATGTLSIGRGGSAGLPAFTDIGIDGSGNVSVTNGSLNVGTSSPNASALLQMSSVSQGFLPPVMTHAQFTFISLPATGLFGYMSDYNAYGYFNGVSFDTVLSINNINAGTNVTLDKSIPGQVTINASGGGTSPSASYASFSTLNNSIATVISATSTFYPVYLGASFSGNDASDFTNQFLTISGMSTPVMTFIGSTTQEFNVNINLSCRGSVPVQSSYTFSIFVLLANGTIVPTQYRNTLTLGDLINYYPVSMTGNVQLNPGDSVFVEVENITNTNNFYAAYATFSVISVAGSSQPIAITQVSGSTQAMVDNAPINRYVLENTSLTTLTLPLSANMTIGHTIEIYGGAAGLWNIAQNAGQNITTSIGGSLASTTIGVTGYAECSNYTDCMTLCYNGGGEFVISSSQTSGTGIILN